MKTYYEKLRAELFSLRKAWAAAKTDAERARIEVRGFAVREEVDAWEDAQDRAEACGSSEYAAHIFAGYNKDPKTIDALADYLVALGRGGDPRMN